MKTIFLLLLLAGCSTSIEIEDQPPPPTLTRPTVKECTETLCGFAPGSFVGVSSEGYCECGCAATETEPDGGIELSAEEGFATTWPPTQEFINTYLPLWEKVCPADTLEP